MPLAMIASPHEATTLSIQSGAALTSEEERRARTIRSTAERDTFIAAHLLVRLCAATHTRTPLHTIQVEQQCCTCGGPHGRPRMRTASRTDISIAHTHQLVAAIAGPGRVGIDIEHLHRQPRRSLWPAVLTPAERIAITDAPDPDRAFLRAWVRKEALIKVGAGTLDQIDQIDTTTLNAGRWRNWWITDFITPTHIGAAATSTQGCQVRTCHSTPAGGQLTRTPS